MEEIGSSVIVIPSATRCAHRVFHETNNWILKAGKVERLTTIQRCERWLTIVIRHLGVTRQNSYWNEESHRLHINTCFRNVTTLWHAESHFLPWRYVCLQSTSFSELEKVMSYYRDIKLSEHPNLRNVESCASDWKSVLFQTFFLKTYNHCCLLQTHKYIYIYMYVYY